MTHIHRWRIAEPDGRKWLPGQCQCGATKEFPASEPEMTQRKIGERTFAREGRARGAS